MWVLFAASVLLLHFVGMRAMAVVPSSVDATSTDDESLYVLAVTIAALSFVTIGAGSAGYLIDDRTASPSTSPRCSWPGPALSRACALRWPRASRPPTSWRC